MAALQRWGLTTGQVSNSRDLEELVVLLHLARDPVGRRHGVVVTKVLGLWLLGRAGRGSGCLRTRLHHGRVEGELRSEMQVFPGVTTSGHFRLKLPR